MSEYLAKASPEVKQYSPFPDEVRAVETAWGAPIPDHLTRIGGVDWWSWAAVRMIIKDDQVTFHGEYWDAKYRYEGEFVYKHPDGAPLPEKVFDNYVMSHISNTEIVFVKNDDSVPRDSFVLAPANPELVEKKE